MASQACWGAVRLVAAWEPNLGDCCGLPGAWPDLPNACQDQLQYEAAAQDLMRELGEELNSEGDEEVAAACDVVTAGMRSLQDSAAMAAACASPTASLHQRDSSCGGSVSPYGSCTNIFGAAGDCSGASWGSSQCFLPQPPHAYAGMVPLASVSGQQQQALVQHQAQQQFGAAPHLGQQAPLQLQTAASGTCSLMQDCSSASLYTRGSPAPAPAGAAITAGCFGEQQPAGLNTSCATTAAPAAPAAAAAATHRAGGGALLAPCGGVSKPSKAAAGSKKRQQQQGATRRRSTSPGDGLPSPATAAAGHRDGGEAGARGDASRPRRACRAGGGTPRGAAAAAAAAAAVAPHSPKALPLSRTGSGGGHGPASVIRELQAEVDVLSASKAQLRSQLQHLLAAHTDLLSRVSALTHKWQAAVAENAALHRQNLQLCGGGGGGPGANSGAQASGTQASYGPPM